MEKPWVLQTPEERKARVETCEMIVDSLRGSPIDEMFLVGLRPPRSESEALLELFLWQCRSGVKKESTL